MSKLLFSGIAIALIILAGNTQAQQPPTSTTPTPQSQPASPTSIPLKATDLPLLNRVIGKFWQTDRVETESKIEVDLSNEKGKTKALVSVKTIAKIGQKFRSELTISQVGKTAKIKCIIVSDSKKTWIYRPDLRQYAQIDPSEFSRTPSASIIGLSSIFFITLDDAKRQELVTDILGENNQIVSLENFKLLQVSQQQINSRNLFAYTFTDKELSTNKIAGFINPRTAVLERIEFKFGDKLKQMEIVETIIKRNPQIAITNKTFTFSPPKGVKKVKSLQIELFNLIKSN